MNTERVVTYLGAKTAEAFRKEAEKMGFNESSYVRFLIIKELRQLKGK